MRALVALIALAPLSGCMYFLCGPTVYSLSAVTASVTFDEPWDDERVAAGFREAGFTPRNLQQRFAGADAGNESILLDYEPNATRLAVSFTTTEQGDHDAVEARADEIIREREPRAREIIDAFARGANWTADTALTWDKGLLHGDC